jgi:hypothetical protein
MQSMTSHAGPCFICKECHFFNTIKETKIGWTGRIREDPYCDFHPELYEMVKYGKCRECAAIHYFTKPKYYNPGSVFQRLGKRPEDIKIEGDEAEKDAIPNDFFGLGLSLDT